MTMNLDVALAVSAPTGAAVAIGVTVAKKGMKLPAGVSAATCARRGFEGKPGQLLALPEESGTRLLVGLGDGAAVTTDALRVAAAAATRASSREPVLALALLDTIPDQLDRGAAVQAVAEGALLGAYRHDVYRGEPPARSSGRQSSSPDAVRASTTTPSSAPVSSPKARASPATWRTSRRST